MSSKKITTQQSYTTYEFPIRKPKTKKSLGQLIYDGEKGRILGRTPKNWGKLLNHIFLVSLINAFGRNIYLLSVVLCKVKPLNKRKSPA